MGASGGQRDAGLLTRREREIVELVAEGLKNKAIGQRLSIAERTVKNHLQSVFRKLGVSNRLELAVQVIRQGQGARGLTRLHQRADAGIRRRGDAGTGRFAE